MDSFYAVQCSNNQYVFCENQPLTVLEAVSTFKKRNLKCYCNIQIFVIENVFSEYCSKQQFLKRLKFPNKKTSVMEFRKRAV